MASPRIRTKLPRQLSEIRKIGQGLRYAPPPGSPQDVKR